jgi:nitrogen fixation NifU-like protein
MSDLHELYQQILLEHSKSPRNFRKTENANRTAEGNNPLCGDRLRVYLVLDENDVIREISFQGSGCAISRASASLMTSAVKGKTREEAEALFGKFRRMATADRGVEVDRAALGKLAALAGVREFPVRVKCATLAWHTLRAALEDRDAEPVTTETE